MTVATAMMTRSHILSPGAGTGTVGEGAGAGGAGAGAGAGGAGAGGVAMTTGFVGGVLTVKLPVRPSTSTA